MDKLNEGDFCREFGLVSSTIQTICKSRTKIVNAFERNGSIIKRFPKPELSKDNGVLLEWFQQATN